MDLQLSPVDRAFREDVRDFLRLKLSARLSAKVKNQKRLTKADYEEWHSALNERGWLAPTWPKEWGGANWTFIQRYIFEIEASAAFAPRTIAFGVNMFGPVVLRYGTDEQKARWLPRILDGSDWWCQGFSEPGAGSDLASLRTSAVRDGDHYVVNGQKTWTTYGQFANRIFCLVRTDPAAKKQAGISFLAIDMSSPGIEVRPIILLDGEHEVNEIFFTDVRVPVDNLVGQENVGWTYAKYLLTHERTGTAMVGDSTAAFARLKSIADTEMRQGKPLSQDPLFAARLARLEIDLANLTTSNLRMLSGSDNGAASMADSAILKIRGSEIRQEISALGRRAAGIYSAPFIPAALEEGFNGEPVGPDFAAAAAPEYLNNRKLSIFAGSNEVQREIITKLTLRL